MRTEEEIKEKILHHRSLEASFQKVLEEATSLETCVNALEQKWKHQEKADLLDWVLGEELYSR